MISISHWGLFSQPGPFIIMPKLTEADEVRLREEWNKPGAIVSMDRGEVIFFSRTTDALDEPIVTA